MFEHGGGNLKLGFSFPLLDGLPMLSRSVYPKQLDLLLKGYTLHIYVVNRNRNDIINKYLTTTLIAVVICFK